MCLHPLSIFVICRKIEAAVEAERQPWSQLIYISAGHRLSLIHIFTSWYIDNILHLKHPSKMECGLGIGKVTIGKVSVF